MKLIIIVLVSVLAISGCKKYRCPVKEKCHTHFQPVFTGKSTVLIPITQCVCPVKKELVE